MRAFSASHYHVWGYNDRNESTGVTRRDGTTVGSGTVSSGDGRVYVYDNIGNRYTYTKGTSPQTTYESNELNQYVNVETASSPVTGQNMIYDADGNVIESYVVGDFDGDGSVGFSDLTIFYWSYGYCEGDPEYDERANLVTGSNPECIDISDQAAFMSLYGLSASDVMRAELLWDAENRLVAYIPLNQSGGAKKVTFKYDYRGRRIEKNVYAWNSGGSAWHTNATERRRFVWNGWLMLRETIETDSASDGTFEATRIKTYSWGKDLGGGLESAGGIGGLLAVYDDSATSGSTGDDLAYVYMYDANGNVGQVCDLTQSTASASIVAKYEYDAYGNATVSTGSYAAANTYRFSTKPWDDETGLGYWGYRYYDPRLGRWMSRDLIGEQGGVGLFAYCRNTPVLDVDPFGLLSIGSPFGQDTRPTTEPASRPCADTPEHGDDTYCKPLCDKYKSHGVTVCNGRTPIICICRENIRASAGDENPTVEAILTECAISHENDHAWQCANFGNNEVKWTLRVFHRRHELHRTTRRSVRQLSSMLRQAPPSNKPTLHSLRSR